jgi:hypothetical protein
MEERMLSFQRSCEERAESDLKRQITHLYETAIAKIRLEESQRARLSLESLRTELESECDRRFQGHLAREAESARRATDKERAMNQALYDSRQLMQRDIDQLRSREQMSARKMELEAQGLKVLEMRLKEAQNMIDGREREIANRERMMDEKSQVSMETARKEALNRVQYELEQLSKERSIFMLERKNLDDHKIAHQTEIDSAKDVRQQLKDCLDQLSLKDEEISSIKRHINIIEARRKDEEKQISEV